jgi:hypothetical protein
MYSSSADPGELKNIAAGAAVLSGIFTALTVLIFIIILVPKLLSPSPLYTILCLFGLAMIASVYGILTSRLQLPFLLHGILFIVLQWFGLWGRLGLVSGKVPPVIYPVFKTIRNSWEWCVALTILWLITVHFI